MGALIKCVGIAGTVLHDPGGSPEGMWLADYDVDAFEGRGTVSWTDKKWAAMPFRDTKTAWEAWGQQSSVLPLRGDGQPNRPTTAFSVEIEEISQQEVHDLFFESYIEMKREAARAGQPVPFLLHYATGNNLITVVLPGRDVLEHACANMLFEYGPPEWVSICSDTWWKEAICEDEFNSIHRGDLEKAFLAGDMTVHEQLIYLAVEEDLSTYQRAIPYTVDDDGEIQYAENVREVGGQMGLVQILTNLIRLGQDEDAAKAFFDYVIAALSEDTDKGE